MSNPFEEEDDLPLASFVPKSVLSRLSQNLIMDFEDEETLIRPHFKSLGDGAVFLLDISSSDNELISQMIQIVHSFKHCEVVRFCGDSALLCICCWPSDAVKEQNKRYNNASTSQDMDVDEMIDRLSSVDLDDDSDGHIDVDALEESNHNLKTNGDTPSQDDALTLALETAIACCLAVQTKVMGEDKTTLHMGIAAGSLMEHFVGGISNQFQYLIQGTPLQYLGEAMETADYTKPGVLVHTSPSAVGTALEGLQKSERVFGTKAYGLFLAQKVDKSREDQFVQSPAASSHFKFDLDIPSTRQRWNQALKGFIPNNLDDLVQNGTARQCTILVAFLPDLQVAANNPMDDSMRADMLGMSIGESIQADVLGGSTHQMFQDLKKALVEHEDESAQATYFEVTQKAVQELQKASGKNTCLFLQQFVPKQQGDNLNGTVAMAVMGLVDDKNEDNDAARAIQAAMTLTARTSCKAVGVATGEVCVKVVGSKEQQRCGYAVVGDAVATAVGLMRACAKLDKEVLVCSTTTARPTWGIAFPEKHTIEVIHGKEEDVFVPTAAADDGSGVGGLKNQTTMSDDEDFETDNPQPDLEGIVRSRELLDIAKVMPGWAVCLTGETGAGKSALAASFAKHAVDANLATGVLYTAADSTQPETSFYAFKCLITDFCRRAGSPEAAFRGCGLDPLLAPLIHPLLEDSPSLDANHSQGVHLSKEEQRQHLVSFVAELVRNLIQTNESGHRTENKLLVIEDVQWIDELSALVVRDLAKKKDCSLLATATQLPSCLEGATLEELPLQPISLDEGKFLAGPFMGSLSEEDVKVLFEKSGGNVLFFKEMLRAAAAERSATNVETSLIDVRACLFSRIQALKPECILLLQAASVFGRYFVAEDAAKIILADSDASEAKELEALALQSELIEQITHPTLQHDEKQLRFSHALIRDVAYSAIPRGALAELHDKAATLVHSHELVEHHRVVAAETSPTALRAKLAVRALNDGTRARIAMGAITLDKARERWEKAQSLLEKIDDPETQIRLELQMTLDQGRAVVAWLGFGTDEVGGLFSKALSLTKRCTDTEEEIISLAALWMNAMANISSKEVAEKALEYAEELRDKAPDPSSITSPGAMDWTVKEIYHVVWTEYSRRGRLRDMKRFLDPLLEDPTPQEGKSVLRLNAETCATIFGAKVAWLTGQFDEALPIASSGIGITNEAFSISLSRVWGVAQILAWNGQLDAVDATLEDKALVQMPSFHTSVREVLMIYRGILKGELPWDSVSQRLLNTLSPLSPWGEFPFTLTYALVQRGYELRLDERKAPRNSSLCEALSLVLEFWRDIRDRSDEWGPGLYHWATGVLQLFEDPISDSSFNVAQSFFGTGSVLAQDEGALGVMLLIEASRVKMMLQRFERLQQPLQDAANELSRIRRLCTGDPAIAAPLAFADDVSSRVAQRRRPRKFITGALTVSVAVGGFFLNKRNRR